MRGDVVERLRVDADEIEACGAGNEAATMRVAADLIASQAAEIAQLKKERDGLTERLATAYRVKAECNDDANNERHLRLTAERLLAEARAALGPFAGDKLPGNNRNIIDYDRYGLRRCISPMEIARRDAFFTLHPDKHPLARPLTNGGENGR